MAFTRNVLLFLLFLCVLLHPSRIVSCSAQKALSPVIIIPGDGASPIDSKIVGNNNCDTRKDWYRLWLNVEDIAIGRFPCTAKNLALRFDPATNKSGSLSDVLTRVPGWGSAHVVEYVDDSYIAKLFHIAYDAVYLTEAMTSWGYTKNVTLRGAPYDFRYAMSSQPEYFDKLQALVEEMYSSSDNRKVTLISHSMGGLYATWFLNEKPQEWKDKYIHAFVALSTPWGGSIKALHGLTSGYNFDVPLVNPRICRVLQRSFESNYLMLPNYRFHEPRHFFIETPHINFTLSPKDINLYFEKTNNKLGQIKLENVMRKNRQNYKNIMYPHPMVKTYCFHGIDRSTPEKLVYLADAFPDRQPILRHSSGDGTIVRESLNGCRYWIQNYQKNFKTDPRSYTEWHELPGVSHLGVFGDVFVQSKIKSILFTD